MDFVNGFLRACSAISLLLGVFLLASTKYPESQFAVLMAILLHLWANEK